MSRSQDDINPPLAGYITLDGNGAPVEAPTPLPAEITVREDVPKSVFIAIRQSGKNPIIRRISREDAEGFKQSLSDVLSSKGYEKERQGDVQAGGTSPADEEAHKMLKKLPVSPDLASIRGWLLGSNEIEDVDYSEWVRMLQASPLCLRWETEQRGNVGYAAWNCSANDDCGHLVVELSTGTRASEDRAIDVVSDVVDSGGTHVMPCERVDTPFVDTSS